MWQEIIYELCQMYQDKSSNLSKDLSLLFLRDNSMFPNSLTISLQNENNISLPSNFFLKYKGNHFI